jgi:NADH-quinone oxidoreductase subunit N
MTNVEYMDLLKLAAPETILVVTALAVLFVDLGPMRRQPERGRMLVGAMLTAAGCVVAAGWTALHPVAAMVTACDGVFVVSPLAQFARQVILALVIFTALISAESRFTRHAGEYFALVLLAAVGMLFLVCSGDMLMIFVSLELTSLALYALTGFHKECAKSSEAALKQFLFGGMASAILLFGMSLVYGMTGATRLEAVATGLAGHGNDPALYLAMVMIAAGFGFKVAAAPFHLWAPDTYQGAPVPCAALIASGSKVAGFYVMAKFFMAGFTGVEGSIAWGNFARGWIPLIGWIAAVSIVFGNLAAIVQSSVRRLLAYSAVAHAGYMLVALPAGDGPGMASLFYYVTTYALTMVGAFAIVGAVEEATGDDSLKAFAGLGQRSPVMAFCLLIFLLSLAGVPPLAGFFGKFYLFAAALTAGPGLLGLLWLVSLAVAMSAVSLYYYLRVLKQAYVIPPPEKAGALAIPLSTRVAAIVLAVLVVLVGVLPGLILDRVASALPAW